MPWLVNMPTTCGGAQAQGQVLGAYALAHVPMPTACAARRFRTLTRSRGRRVEEPGDAATELSSEESFVDVGDEVDWGP